MSAKAHGKVRIFVYGTLKDGSYNSRLMEAAKAQFVGYDSITGPYDLIEVMQVPALIHRDPDASNKKRTIRGEVYAGGTDLLEALDILEANDLLYKRVKVWSDIHKQRVWTYFITPVFLRNVPEKEIKALTEDCWMISKNEYKFWRGRNSE